MTQKRSGLIRKGMVSLQRRWQSIAGSEYDIDAASVRPDLPAEDQPGLKKQMARCLEARGGEVAARAKAAALGRAYLALNETGRGRFLGILAQDFGLKVDDIEASLEALRKARTPEAAREATERFREAARSPRTRILTRFNALPEGVKFLVDLRHDLLLLAKKDATLACLESDLKALLTSWFDVDFLELRRISWDTASGALLERFMAYEAVHPVESWEDLKNRLDYDRRYFAFFHPRMPEEPLIFLEVALQKGIAGSIESLLDPEAPVLEADRADTAIFYSISNAQPGLKGINFGGFLIKRVLDELSRELPHLKRYVTLSPIPGLMEWLHSGPNPDDLLSPQLKRGMTKVLGSDRGEPGLLEYLRERTWAQDPQTSEALRAPLLHLAARYLVQGKRADGGMFDPVAHFHLSNGARVERLNWMGDPSERGLSQSAGIMVSYRYDPARIEANHEAFEARGTVSVSGSVRSHLKA
jgi:malonyl-CoA decarboxylase